ncbi:Trk system potassium transporter TrkA [soil metagenome]
MKIVILGAGRVGESLAENLATRDNDVTVVDTDRARLAALQERLDLRGLHGSGILPSVLRDAGAEDADLLIAVIALDESNLVACKLAHQLFNVPTRIARVRSPQFQDAPEITGSGGFEAQRVICPEQTVVEMIERLIETPEALQVVDFGRGRLSLVVVRTVAGGPLVDHNIGTIKQHMPDVDIRIVAVVRNEESIPVTGETIIQPGDEVFCLAEAGDIRAVLSELSKIDRPVRRVIIAGGGNIGLRLALGLTRDYNVKIIEADKRRCESLAEQLKASVLVLNGDATDEGLLAEENVRSTDMFLALTSDDEDNIMSCLLAKRMGARRTLAIINRKSYAQLVQGGAIDIAISPSQVTIGELLRHVRRGDIVNVHSLRRGAAEALEIIAHGERGSSRVVGRRIDEIDLPQGATIGALVRGLTPADEASADSVDPKSAKVLMAHHDTVIEAGDHFIVFADDPRTIPRVERLFQVSASFF